MEQSPDMKAQLQRRFNSAIDKNFKELLPFVEINLSVMVELTRLRNEIISCLLLELYQASIFSTNHFLERLIKIALIKNHTIGFNYLNAEAYNQKIEESKILFDSLILADSLKKANEYNLITAEELVELTNIRKKIRNPFSHAEVAKINVNSPPVFSGFIFNLDDIKAKLMNNDAIELPEMTEINSFSPTFAQLHQEENSKILAFDYFKKVHRVMLDIEKRISEKRQA